ncbi:DUF4372 domain-containing protein [Prevotella sp. HUN102]|uniref:DUF4372 domain-containing protein n=1 Tax=Prevotella sp. HUN102 TaxID=1392486 RepID=UPI002100D68E|nr:DUF4372 domain-containing protein [Prevotella sp. HUN102]
MNQGKTVFAQIMSLIPRYEFDKCVKRYNGNRHAIGFKCRDQFIRQFGIINLKKVPVVFYLPNILTAHPVYFQRNNTPPMPSISS